MSDDVRRRLDEAGRVPVAPPDAAFADCLESRLRAVAAGLPPHRPPARRRPAVGRWAMAAGFAAVVVIVAALGLELGRADRAAGPGLALAAPVNVEVVLVNGTILEDPDGLLLPEGAIVRVGEGGSARIGETVLGPGDVATVLADRVEVQRPSPVAVVPDPQPIGTPRPEETPGPSSLGPSASPTSSPSPTPIPSAVADRTSSPASTSEATRRPTATVVATSRPTPTATPSIVRPRLRAVLLDGPRIAVRWTATWSASRYVLVATGSRSGPADDPVYPGSRIIGEFVVPPERAFRVRVPDGIVEVRLMVVALREDGRVLRRSRIVAIAIPVPADPMGETGPSPTAMSAPGTPASASPPLAP